MRVRVTSNARALAEIKINPIVRFMGLRLILTMNRGWPEARFISV
jgi:hypothetical protein